MATSPHNVGQCACGIRGTSTEVTPEWGSGQRIVPRPVRTFVITGEMGTCFSAKQWNEETRSTKQVCLTTGIIRT